MSPIELRNQNHKDFVKAIIETKGQGRQHRAYQKAYPNASYEVARANACRLLNREDIKLSLIEEFKAQGLTKEEAIREHNSLVKAKVLRVSADTKLNAINLYYKLTGMLTDNSGNTVNQQINIGSEGEVSQSLKQILKEITALNNSLNLKQSNSDEDNVLDNNNTSSTASET